MGGGTWPSSRIGKRTGFAPMGLFEPPDIPNINSNEVFGWKRLHLDQGLLPGQHMEDSHNRGAR